MEKYGENIGDIFYGEVSIESEVPEIAQNCYLKAYETLGFDYTIHAENKNGYGFSIYFVKNRPENGWEPIEEVITYTNKRGVMYDISEQKIKMKI